jgi:hypothetical protein
VLVEAHAKGRAGVVDRQTIAIALFLPLWIQQCRWWPNHAYSEVPVIERPSYALPNFCTLPPAKVLRIFSVPLPSSLLSLEDPYLEDFHIMPVKKSGKAGPKQRARNELKALVAWRMREDGLSIFQALNFASERSLDFYETERGFQRALTKAKKKFQQLEQHFSRYLDAVDHGQFSREKIG